MRRDPHGINYTNQQLTWSSFKHSTNLEHI